MVAISALVYRYLLNSRRLEYRPLTGAISLAGEDGDGKPQ